MQETLDALQESFRILVSFKYEYLPLASDGQLFWDMVILCLKGQCTQTENV